MKFHKLNKLSTFLICVRLSKAIQNISKSFISVDVRLNYSISVCQSETNFHCVNSSVDDQQNFHMNLCILREMWRKANANYNNAETSIPQWNNGNVWNKYYLWYLLWQYQKKKKLNIIKNKSISLRTSSNSLD